MTFDPISYSLAKKKLGWKQIKTLLETEGSINALYDSDKDGVIDADKVNALLSRLQIDVDKDWGGHVIKNLGTPVDPNDVARKTDVDTVQQNLDTHASLSGGTHGVPSGDRILHTGDIGVANGVCPLDANALVPLTNIPTTLTGISADMVDGYHAGTGANNVLVLDSNGLVPLTNIPVLDWTKLQFFGVRQEILAEFSDPKLVIATTSMLQLLNSSEKVEAASGNITATSKELTIVGGTATASGRSWVFFDLPDPASKIYIRSKMNSVNAQATYIAFAQSAGNIAWGNTSFYGYAAGLVIPLATADFKLWKCIGGTTSILASEAVDLSNNVYYDVEIYCDLNTIKVWRDGVLKFDAIGDTTNVTEINSIQFACYDALTTATQTSKYKGVVVIIYE